MKSEFKNLEGMESKRLLQKVFQTQIYSYPSLEECRLLGEKIRQGELVAIPTETVYGLGANGLDEEAISRIYEAKGRPSDNPLILHVPNQKSILPLVTEINATAKKLMDMFWPGPLTITLPKSDLVPDRVTGGLAKVALRCPDHEVCQAFLLAAGVPVAAPSANISGRPSPTTAAEVFSDMNGRIESIIDAGPCSIGVESTVVECSDDEVIILRPGGVTAEELAKVVSKVSYDSGLAKGATPKAPGMKYRHYAPNAGMQTFIGKAEAVAQVIKEKSAPFLGQGKKIGLLVSAEVNTLLESWLAEQRGTTFQSAIFGSRREPERLAYCLYTSLLAFNEGKVDLILAEGVEPKGIGVAIMNRMEKACNYEVFKV